VMLRVLDRYNCRSSYEINDVTKNELYKKYDIRSTPCILTKERKLIHGVTNCASHAENNREFECYDCAGGGYCELNTDEARSEMNMDRIEQDANQSLESLMQQRER